MHLELCHKDKRRPRPGLCCLTKIRVWAALPSQEKHLQLTLAASGRATPLHNIFAVTCMLLEPLMRPFSGLQVTDQTSLLCHCSVKIRVPASILLLGTIM